MSDKRYFALKDELGLEPAVLHERDPKTGEHKEHPNAGQPGPIQQVGVQVAVPVINQATGELVTEIRTETLKPVEAGGRVVATSSLAVATALLDSGQYDEVDPPKSKQTRTEREEK